MLKACQHGRDNLSIPEVRGEIVASLAQLKSDDLAHGNLQRQIRHFDKMFERIEWRDITTFVSVLKH
jgi:hypothetical protein